MLKRHGMGVVVWAGLCACSASNVQDPDTDREDTNLVETDTDVPFPELDPSACAPSSPAELGVVDPTRALPRSGDAMVDRLFPLLAALWTDTSAQAALDDDNALATLIGDDQDRLVAAKACDGEATCVRDALRWSDDDLDALGARLVADLTGGTADFVPRVIDPLGTYALATGPDDGARLAAMWADAGGDLRAAWDRFVGGVDASTLKATIDALDDGWHDEIGGVLASATVAVMRAQGRDEGARYEPLVDGENGPALERLATLDLSQWRFAVILVPGQGPTDLVTALNPLGAERCDTAVARWKAGLAPFLLTSGGHVHPDGTSFSEAIEMKRYLMETHGVPEDAILVDPYARHTTTNLRNLGRTMLRAGVDPDAPLLVTSDLGQAGYIGALLAPRCEEELGMIPWREMAKLTLNDLCVRTSVDSLVVDAGDPLDP